MKRLEKVQDQEFCCEIVLPRCNKETSFMNSQQHAYLRMTSKMMAPIDMLVWKKEISRSFKPRQKPIDSNNAESGRNSLMVTFYFILCFLKTHLPPLQGFLFILQILHVSFHCVSKLMQWSSSHQAI